MFHIFKRFSLKTSMRTIGVLGVALLISHTASAQFAPTPCDPNYYESLEARAWLEAQREITQNQNLIVKPDSVLEYTCFDGHLAELADHAEDMFSETDRWGGSVIPNRTRHMDRALITLVSRAFNQYDNANFNHGFLGGRIRAGAGTGWASPPGAPAQASGFEYDAPNPAASANIGGSYECEIMQAVWQRAKCMNFIDSAANDGFFTFDNYETSADKRFLPTVCGGGTPLADWVTNREDALPPIAATTPWDFDDVLTYQENISPTTGPACGGGTNRVRTGLVVFNNSGNPQHYNEYVCLVPGCTWVPTGTGTATAPSNSGSCQP